MSSAERRAEAMSALDAIHDPCSVSIGRPIGLVAMGIIEGVDIAGETVTVSVLPTFPDCMFRTVFEERIEAALRALAWCEEVSVRFCPADRAWDESRMAPEAIRSLGRRQRAGPAATGRAAS
ncbi:MAG TPA: iron-sulfur cluster assembly protein [Bauldia sp.]|nr:iron-sulfur cluster assembly protein [Bauldia sp.]